MLAFGRVSLYEPRGDYQLIVEQLEAAGEGVLKQRYEALKRKLQAEGLFDEDRKQPLPALPARIGVITSPSGAVIRDILNVLARRWPLASVRLYPVPVQGEDAAPAIVRALAAEGVDGSLKLVVASSGLHDVSGREPSSPEKATLLGPCLVIPQEHPNVTCLSVDLDPSGSSVAEQAIAITRIALIRVMTFLLSPLEHQA